jgi:TRAP-type mannitol/chloroaromatic compound transport system substrate-binding protein
MARRFITAVSLLLLASVSAGAEDSEPVTLVMPVVYGGHLSGLGTPAVNLARLVKERSKGALVLDVKQPGEGIGAYDILDKVSDGSIDAGFTTPSFWAAKIPAAALFAGFPFGPDGKTYLAWFKDGNGRMLYQELYDHADFKVHALPCAFGGAETGGWFAKEIKSKKDIEGLRMRIFGLGARVMAKLGATTLIVLGKDLPKAFEKNEIDAAELYTPAADREQGLQDKVKLIYVPGWHQPETVLELIINRDRWEALTEEQRTLIEGACRDMLKSTLEESAKLQAKALGGYISQGVRVETWPEDVLEAMRSAWTELAKDEGERDYFFHEVLEDIEKFRARQALPKQTGSAPASPPPQDAPARANPRTGATR